MGQPHQHHLSLFKYMSLTPALLNRKLCCRFERALQGHWPPYTNYPVRPAHHGKVWLALQHQTHGYRRCLAPSMSYLFTDFLFLLSHICPLSAPKHGQLLPCREELKAMTPSDHLVAAGDTEPPVFSATTPGMKKSLCD